MTEVASPETLKSMILSLRPEITAADLNPDTDLYQLGAVDSYSMFQLIMLMEERLGIVFDYSHMKAFHFQSISSILDLLKRSYA